MSRLPGFLSIGRLRNRLTVFIAVHTLSPPLVSKHYMVSKSIRVSALEEDRFRPTGVEVPEEAAARVQKVRAMAEAACPRAKSKGEKVQGGGPHQGGDGRKPKGNRIFNLNHCLYFCSEHHPSYMYFRSLFQILSINCAPLHCYFCLISFK